MPPFSSTLEQRVSALLGSLEGRDSFSRSGYVTRLTGPMIESRGPMTSIGDLCSIESNTNQEPILAEVVGFREHDVLLMPFGLVQGIRPGCRITSLGTPLEIPIGEGLLGRVVDGLGRPLEGPKISGLLTSTPLYKAPPHPLRRTRIEKRFHTGIKAVDLFMPMGRGQRMGIFAGSGVGKSTLLGMMADHGDADVNVIALIGERGREVREFIERDLNEESRRKSIIVVATSDEPPIVRLKGAFTAMSIAEHFRDQGKNVLLMMDSVTRLAMAQREIGLSVGEIPTNKGYTPSVFAILPQLLERAGCGTEGSITGLFTVLVEGDDMNDPIADAVRSILDGHVILTRELATANHYPAIDVLQSVSRLQRDLADPTSAQLTQAARQIMALYKENKELISLGAYTPGSNADLDLAIALMPKINQVLQQGCEEGATQQQAMEELSQSLASASTTN